MNSAIPSVDKSEAVSLAKLISRAYKSAQELGRSPLEILQEISDLEPHVLLDRLSNILHYPIVTMDDLRKHQPAFDVLPYTECLQRLCVASRIGDKLTVAFVDPLDSDTQVWVDNLIRMPYTSVLASRGDVTAYLARHEDTLRAMDLVTLTKADIRNVADTENLSFDKIAQDTSPVVKLVHSTLYDALKADVSDIHLETGPIGLTIKYRIDGVLTTVNTVNNIEFSEQAISRIKVMAELDIAERRTPQDGRFKISIQGREIDFRVSIMPSIYGEDAVLRILDKRLLANQSHGLRLEYLGFNSTTLVKLRRLASDPYGMILVTGPTGSGKTTTLYAMISEINHGSDKIITIEDPVEYQLPGILQVPVNDKKGLTFARGLRSILRHDPDKIMIGEIRDPETAQIAVQSALTGHLVFTTVHANNTFDVIGRMLHMGLDTYSFISAVNAILAQRLVRINCPQCTTAYLPESNLLNESKLHEHANNFTFKQGTGCTHCRGSGYRGRRAIAELLILNDELRELINTRVPIHHIKESAVRYGTIFLRESALDLVRTGETTLEEINRVTFVG